MFKCILTFIFFCFEIEDLKLLRLNQHHTYSCVRKVAHTDTLSSLYIEICSILANVFNRF